MVCKNPTKSKTPNLTDDRGAWRVIKWLAWSVVIALAAKIIANAAWGWMHSASTADSKAKPTAHARFRPLMRKLGEPPLAIDALDQLAVATTPTNRLNVDSRNSLDLNQATRECRQRDEFKQLERRTRYLRSRVVPDLVRQIGELDHRESDMPATTFKHRRTKLQDALDHVYTEINCSEMALLSRGGTGIQFND